MEKPYLNVLICIFHRKRQDAERSHINKTLEELQRRLVEIKRDYSSVRAAFAFNDGLADGRDFEEVSEDMLYYLEVRGKASLSSVYFMGMAMMERQIARDRKDRIDSENIFCLLTDAPFPKNDAEKILMTPRFKNLELKLVLIRDEVSAGGSLEEYFKKNGKVYDIKQTINSEENEDGHISNSIGKEQY